MYKKQQILAPDLACLLALFEQLASKPDESDELALAAVHVFESYGQTHRLLTAQITNEAKTTRMFFIIIIIITSKIVFICLFVQLLQAIFSNLQQVLDWESPAIIWKLRDLNTFFPLLRICCSIWNLWRIHTTR